MIGIIVISSLISLSRGFVKEALSLLTWIVAGAVAWMFGGALAERLAPYIQLPSGRVIAACALLFVVTLLLGALVNFLISELVRVTGMSDQHDLVAGIEMPPRLHMNFRNQRAGGIEIEQRAPFGLGGHRFRHAMG